MPTIEADKGLRDFKQYMVVRDKVSGKHSIARI